MTKEQRSSANKKQYDKFKSRKKLLVCKLGGCCVVCGDTSIGLHLHHEVYGPESDYPRNARSMGVRLKRLSEAEQFPDRFRLLCQLHHTTLEQIRKTNKCYPLQDLIDKVGVMNMENVIVEREAEF